MKHKHRMLPLLVATLCLAGGLSVAQTDASDDDAKGVKKTVGSTVETQKATQEKQDGWEAEKALLIQRYRTAQAHIDFLEQREASLNKEANAIDAAIAELERRLTESDKLTANLQDTLVTVVERLDAWVQRDVPFLIGERTSRVEALKTEIVKPDVTGAEKLRRVLEALAVEAGYGGTVEVDNDEIMVNGEDLFVDILRIGRVSVFWRTPDGKRVGEYNAGAGQWMELPGKYARPIGQAMEMASRMRPVEIIALPLGRIVP